MCPFALRHSVTDMEKAASQCQWPCSHRASPYTGNSRHTLCPEPGQQEIRNGSKGPRHKGPAACRALALHRRKQGLLNILETCDLSFYSGVVPNGKLVVEMETHRKWILRQKCIENVCINMYSLE